jgi:hypothetical protein
MKKLFNKTWFQVLLAGIIIGVVLIIVDNKFWRESLPRGSEIYDGPVKADKNKVYFTRAALNETSFDFGKAIEGDTLTHVFKLTNTGDEPLFVYKTSASCDCVAAVVTKEMIRPGASVDITAYFSTKGRKGEQKRTIEITCNTEPAVLTVTLKADVQ